jgi:hypothetical protein
LPDGVAGLLDGRFDSLQTAAQAWRGPAEASEGRERELDGTQTNLIP